MKMRVRVGLIGTERCAIKKYLQRMDFFKRLDIPMAEDFQRRASKGRFVEVVEVGIEVGTMAGNLASCIAPGGEDFGHPMAAAWDLLSYVFTETADNAREVDPENWTGGIVNVNSKKRSKCPRKEECTVQSSKRELV